MKSENIRKLRQTKKQIFSKTLIVFKLISVSRKQITRYTVINYKLLLLYHVHNYIIRII